MPCTSSGCLLYPCPSLFPRIKQRDIALKNEGCISKILPCQVRALYQTFQSTKDRSNPSKEHDIKSYQMRRTHPVTVVKPVVNMRYCTLHFNMLLYSDVSYEHEKNDTWRYCEELVNIQKA